MFPFPLSISYPESPLSCSSKGARRRPKCGNRKENARHGRSDRIILLAFVDVLQTDAFEEDLSLDSVNILSLFGWVNERHIPEARHILSLMTEKAARRGAEESTSKRVYILAHTNDSCLQEMGSEQLCQLVGCKLANATDAKKDIRLNYIFKEVFNSGGLTGGLLYVGVFLRKVLEAPPGQRGSPLPDMLAPQKTIQTLL